MIVSMGYLEPLVNIWSARSLSIYGKVTIIKSFLIPKYIYICSILPAPRELLKKLNKILFKFLWKGVDEVTRASVINEYEEGGLRPRHTMQQIAATRRRDRLLQQIASCDM